MVRDFLKKFTRFGGKTKSTLLIIGLTAASIVVYAAGGGGGTIPTGPGATTPNPSTGTLVNVATGAACTGNISTIQVALNGVTHTWPDDIVFVLGTPGGSTCTLMADVGGSTDINGVNLIIADGGPTMPGSGGITSGTWGATNTNDWSTNTYQNPTGTDITVPAVCGLNSYIGTSVSGTWNLFGFDQVSGDGGSYTGWDVRVTTSTGETCRFNAPTAGQGVITGIVKTPFGRGLANATVLLVDTQTGEEYRVRTGQRGHFRIDNLAIGNMHVISVQSKRYSFNSQTFMLNEDLTGLELTGF